MREQRKELVGRVVSDRMQKTVVVAVNSLRRHRLYQRTMRRTKKYMAHDEHEASHVGDLVRIQESRPISKHKHWKVITILEQAASRGKAVDLPAIALSSRTSGAAAKANADVTTEVLPGTERQSAGVERDVTGGTSR